jgi:hypothetical protein
MRWSRSPRVRARALTSARCSDGNLFAPSRGNAIDGGFRSTKANPAALALGVGAAAVGALTLAGAWALRQRRGA